MKPSRSSINVYIIAIALLFSSCAGNQSTAPSFFTSGSHEADQRADQRVAKDQQLSSGAGGSGKDNVQKTLFERLGGDKGVQGIVDDFVNRAMADPRVNWDRKGVKAGGFLGVGSHSEQWQHSEQNIITLKTHMAQFISLATGGPASYDGREIKQAHQGMKITNAEFDAAVGDLKATLDKLKIATADQRELLSIIESTRPQIVEERS